MARTAKSIEAERNFRSKIEELGGTFSGEWAGLRELHEVLCSAGHLIQVRPCNILKGYGMCRICGDRITGQGSTRDKASFAAEASFRKRVNELGGIVLEETWKGSKQPHRVLCSEGHETYPRPQSVNIGNGLCEKCGQANKTWTKRSQKSIDAEASFREHLETIGATLLEGAWLGSHTPHRVTCSKGHACSPMPANIRNGQGVCLKCTWMNQDIFYLVRNPERNWVKFGITSLNPRPRLGVHAAAGFGEVLVLHQGLPVGVAYATEQAVIKALHAEGVNPVKGKEYFDGSHEGFILSFIRERLS